jgi:transcriptional regulator with XRE-family HTH domain
MFYISNMDTLASLNPRAFGRAFRAERRALGRTQQQVAEAAGLRRQNVADLEAGRNVSLHTVFAALAVLGKGVLIANARPDLERLHLLADPDDES